MNRHEELLLGQAGSRVSADHLRAITALLATIIDRPSPGEIEAIGA
jgi:hypothetical protein